MHAIQKPAAEKILEKGLQISEHMLICMMWSMQYVLPGRLTTFQWWGTLYYFKNYSQEVVKMFAVYIFWNVHCNRIVWWMKFVISKIPVQHTKFPLMDYFPCCRKYSNKYWASKVASVLQYTSIKQEVHEESNYRDKTHLGGVFSWLSYYCLYH